MNGESPGQPVQMGDEDAFNSYIDNHLQLMRDVYDSKTINNIRKEMVDQLKKYVIDGKDIILSNLSGVTLELFRRMSELLDELISMQIEFYFDPDKKIMKKGIIMAIDKYHKATINLLLSTRAVGDDRDRILISSPNHAFNRVLAGQQAKKRGAWDRWTGKKEDPPQELY